jgi:hypothetical protein
VDAAVVNAIGCHEGSWQFDYCWMGQSRPGLGRDHVNRPDSGGDGQSEGPGPNPGILVGDVLSSTSGQGTPRKPPTRVGTAAGGRTPERTGTAEGSGQGQGAGGGTAKGVGALGNRAVGSLTRAATRTGARQDQEMAVTATCFQGGRGWNGFDRPILGSRTNTEEDGTHRTDGRSRAGADGGNYGVGSNRT